MVKTTLQRKTYNAGLLQGKAYRIFTNHLSQVLSSHNLTIPEWKLLGQLADQGNMKLAKLAELMGVEAPLVTSLVDALEKKKLVKRTNDLSDKRAKVIEGTKKAMQLIESIEPEIRTELRSLVRGASKEDVDAYLRVLDIIVTNG